MTPAGSDPPSDPDHPHLGRADQAWTYHDADGRVMFLVCRWDKSDGKVILPLSYGNLDGRTGWHWRHVKAPRPLFGLECLAKRRKAPVLILEGEKTAEAARRAPFADHVTITWPGGSNAVDKADWTPLKGRRVVVWPDADEAGRKAAQNVAKAALNAGAAEVRVVEPPNDVPTGWDLADPLKGYQPSALRELIERATAIVNLRSHRVSSPDRTRIEDIDTRAAIERLATLPRIEYDRERKETAKRLGILTGTLDKEVADARDDVESDDLQVPEVIPCDEEVDAHDLLNQIMDGISRYVVMPPSAAAIVALWVMHTYAFDVWRITPRLYITAPEKGCGKSTLLDVLEMMVQRPVKSENLTAAVFFRVVDRHRPTVLIDEADSQLRDNEDKRNALNAGHKHGARFYRCEGERNKVKSFKVFAPVAIAGIGRLPATLEDRSIKIALEKRTADEPITDFREDRADDLREIAAMAARWVDDQREKLQDADPEMPTGLHNRTADNWRALLAIADIAGGDWPDRARQVAMRASEVDASDDPSIEVQLLADLRDLFRKEGAHLHSERIVNALTNMKDRPWPEFRRGKPLGQNSLGRMLSRYRTRAGIPVRSRNLLIAGKQAKGYRAEDLENAFARYLVDQSVNPSNGKESGASSEIQSVHSESDWTLWNPRKPAQNLGLDGLTGESTLSGDNKNGDDGDADERAAIQEIDGNDGADA